MRILPGLSRPIPGLIAAIGRTIAEMIIAIAGHGRSTEFKAPVIAALAERAWPPVFEIESGEK